VARLSLVFRVLTEVLAEDGLTWLDVAWFFVRCLVGSLVGL